MEEGDEFYEDVKRIEKKWYIGDILDVKEQKKSGEIVNRNPAYVGRGDFVDMEVVAIIQCRTTLRVSFAMRTITILDKKSKVSTRFVQYIRRVSHGGLRYSLRMRKRRGR